MHFFHEFCSSYNFENPLFELKSFQASSAYGKHKEGKEYPGCSKFSPKSLNKPVTIDPLSKYVIEQQCAHGKPCFMESFTYKPLKTAKVMG